jgi:hypothetical protein
LTILDPARSSSSASRELGGEGIEEALEANRKAAAMLPVTNPSGNSNSSPISVYAAALSRDGTVYAALSPFNRFEGPLVVQFDKDGTPVRTLRCQLPKDPTGKEVITPAHIGVSGDRLLLVSGKGDVLTYGL